jgi:hypothetical protein
MELSRSVQNGTFVVSGLGREVPVADAEADDVHTRARGH